MKKLYVSNLNFNASENDLANLFEQYGPVTDIKVIFDRETNRSRGFAFVTFEKEEDASHAIADLNNTEFMGRALNVDVAADRPRNNNQRSNYRQSNSNRY